MQELYGLLSSGMYAANWSQC